MTQDGAPSDGMRYGFGVVIDEDDDEETLTELRHGGSLENQIKSRMVMHPEAGRGIVVLVSGIGPSATDPANTLLDEIVEEWKDHY